MPGTQQGKAAEFEPFLKAFFDFEVQLTTNTQQLCRATRQPSDLTKQLKSVLCFNQFTQNMHEF